jgi:xanthine dehydrogenase accessory factor
MAGELFGLIVLVKGAGEVASAVAHRLHRSRFCVCLTETDRPLAVSRGTTYSEAVFDGSKTIEGVTAELAAPGEIPAVWARGNMPVIIDPGLKVRERIKPDVLVDATMTKLPTATLITDAPLVIGIGTGFRVGRDAHAVVESNNSVSLGRVLLEGEAEGNTGRPVAIGNLTRERVVWAPVSGVFTTNKKIGDTVAAGETLGYIEGVAVAAPLSGMLRGLIRSGVTVPAKAKIIEVDPVNDASVCYIIRDRMRSIAGGVLEAIMFKMNTTGRGRGGQG